MNPSPANAALTATAPTALFGRASAIGLGCVTFGREIDQAASFAMMDHAVSRGVAMFDTAAAYGAGASETAVGAWLAAHRDLRPRLTIATKMLPPYSPARVEASLGESLARLKLDSVDVLFLHQWNESALEPETLQALQAVVADGRVRRLGVSNFSTVQLSRMIELQKQLGSPTTSALQNVHNFAARGFDGPLRELCARAGVEPVGYSPLGAGFLTGKHRGGVVEGSRFALIPGHQAVYFNDLARARLARLEEVAARAQVPMALLAVAWALRDLPDGIVLVGGRNNDQLDQAFAARDQVDPALVAQLAA